MYAIKRTDQGGGYVAPAGSHKSYTKNVRNAQLFTNREDAERNRCPGNEVIVDLGEVENILNVS